MTRKLKSLGIALVAILAISAIAASAASAQTNGTLTSDGPVTLIGHQEGGGGSNSFTAKFGETESKITCANATFTYHKYNVTPHERIQTPTTTLTRTPHYSGCTADGLPMTIDMNGCDQVLHIGPTTGGGDTYGVTMTTVCPAEKHMQMTVFSSSSHALRVCTITFTENAAGYPGLHITDNTDGTFTLSGTATGLFAEKSGLCGTPKDENAKWDMLSTAEGLDSEGKETPISITH